MQRLKLTVAFEGTAYAGWQIQSGGTRPVPSIQGCLEAAFARIAGNPVRVHGAGRTDAGVHADGQVCHADVDETKMPSDGRKALNACLPPDIRVLSCIPVEAAFHARKSTVGKRYAYSIWAGRDKPVPRIRNFVAQVPPLDLDPLQAALPHITGRHDFASFQNAGAATRNTVRELYSIQCRKGEIACLRCPEDWPVLNIIFAGNGFLKQMVRNLSGMLIHVGAGKISPVDIPGIMDARDRRALPSPCAPARGLTLLEVMYPENISSFGAVPQK
ncbi:MAG: tRNA pseudouridine(38-40) synthase TruA [Desulfovibrio sp.]|jgi:tRNA pseudouridine38-40 synthase|nr:tRNA pseudouridine(38-40) synthase TruA [Desulfovibrio sp.]